MAEWLNRAAFLFYHPWFFFFYFNQRGLLPKFPRIVQPRHVVGSSFFFVSELARLAVSTPNFPAFDISALTPRLHSGFPPVWTQSRGRSPQIPHRTASTCFSLLIAMHAVSPLCNIVGYHSVDQFSCIAWQAKLPYCYDETATLEMFCVFDARLVQTSTHMLPGAREV